MAGVLFLLDVVAFVIVVWWALPRSAAGGASPDTGWLGMRSRDSSNARASAPSWRVSARQGSEPREGDPEEPRLSNREPGWKPSRPRSPPPA